jgi:hypothetical protein
VTASTEVLIGDAAAQHVLMKPLAWSHPGLFDERDGNWIDCEFRIAAGAFRAEMRADVKSEEFRTFLEDVEGIRGTLEGTAVINTSEGQIALTLTGDGMGQVRVEGTAIDEVGNGNQLQFGFEVDQVSMLEVCRSLEHLLAAYPAGDPSSQAR